MIKYIFLSGPAYGHVNPTLAIAQELVRRGEQVVYYLTEEFRATAEATGAILQPYQSTIGLRQPSASGQPGKSRWLSQRNERESRWFPRRDEPDESEREPLVIPQVLERIRAERADVILYDPMCLWARLVAQILHVPAILLNSAYAP